jgi:hypothetical protein
VYHSCGLAGRAGRRVTCAQLPPVLSLVWSSLSPGQGRDGGPRSRANGITRSYIRYAGLVTSLPPPVMVGFKLKRAQDYRHIPIGRPGRDYRVLCLWFGGERSGLSSAIPQTQRCSSEFGSWRSPSTSLLVGAPLPRRFNNSHVDD